YGMEPEKGDLPLPANAKATAFGVVSSTVDSDAAGAVRHQAYCLYYITSPPTPGTQSVPPPPETFAPAQHFRAEALCVPRVRLRNVSRIPVSVQLLWGAVATGILAETGLRAYTLAGRTPGASRFETIWQVPGTSTTMFLVRQVLTETGEPPYVVLQGLTRVDMSECR